MYQDAYFWRALEVICEEMNLIIWESAKRG
jgi:hypothetical protein